MPRERVVAKKKDTEFVSPEYHETTENTQVCGRKIPVRRPQKKTGPYIH